MGFFDSLFGGGEKYKNPADKAKPYLDQVPGQVGQYYSPYINAGGQALGRNQNEYNSLLGGRGDLQNILMQLLKNPGDFYNQIGKGYQESPGYQFRRDQGLNAINNAAAAGGLAGSQQHQQQAGQLAGNLAEEDYQRYLQQVLGLFGQGLEGTGNLYERGLRGNEELNRLGYGASGDLAKTIYDNLQSQANLAYAGQENQNQYDQARRGSRNSLIGSGIGAGLGYAFGGPAGGALGSQAGSRFQDALFGAAAGRNAFGGGR